MSDMVNGDAFPMSLYLESVAHLLKSAKYEDNNYKREEREMTLRHTYRETAKYFLQKIQQGDLDMSLEHLEPRLASCVAYAINCNPLVPADVKVTLAIYFTYTMLYDDRNKKCDPMMESFYEDLIQGKDQKNPMCRLMNEHLLDVVKHYGGFCASTIIRGTFDFIQGCWIEQHNFPGFPRSHDYPVFVRRLSGLGHAQTGSLFPTQQFDEQVLFTEIVSAIPSIENAMIFINDLISFYKEFDDPEDEVILVRNYCIVEGISLHQALRKLTSQAVCGCEQLFAVFDDKTPQVKAAIFAFLQGYITWHLTSDRYRMDEVFEQAGDSPDGLEFRRYYEQVRVTVWVSLDEWAVPLASILEEDQANPVPLASILEEEQANPVPLASILEEEQANPIPLASILEEEQANPIPLASILEEEQTNPVPLASILAAEQGNPVETPAL